MNPTLMQDLAATIAADRRHEAERVREAGTAAARRASGRRRRLSWARRAAAPVASGGLDPAPRA